MALVGNKCSEKRWNDSITNIMLIKCTSHKIHFEVKKVRTENLLIVQKARPFMVKLRTPLMLFRFPKHKFYKIYTQNVTRWTSTIGMIKLQVRLCDWLAEIFDMEAKSFILSQAQRKMMDNLLQRLWELNLITLWM